MYAHRTNPALSPATAPARVERGQYSPNIINGMNCAAAANESKPIDARATDRSVASKCRYASAAIPMIAPRRTCIMMRV